MKALANPRESDMEKIKTLARHLVGHPRYVTRFCFQHDIHSINIFTDSDWAGNPVSRKSTSGEIRQLGNHCLES